MEIPIISICKNNTITVATTIKGAKGIADFLLNFFGNRYIKNKDINAPIQTDNKKAEIPYMNPSKYPTPKNKITSPIPTAFPFENMLIRKNGKAIKIPENRSK